jgi:hypothetical protein
VADVDNSLLRIYVDGVQRNTAAYDGSSVTGTSDLHIGSGSGEIEQEWDGIIDEVRIASEALSADWIKTSFENQDAPSAFYNLGDQETSGISPTGKEMSPAQGNAGATMLFDSVDDEAYWYTEAAYPTGNDDATIVAGAYSFNMYFSQTPQLPSDWYDADWDYRKKITIDPAQVVADETSFPVLISFASDSDLAAHAQDDHDDILFTSSDGVTKLSHEIEEFNGSTGKLVAWVKADISGSLDTEIYMYYGNDTIGNQEDETGVWTNSYAAVYHLNNDPGPGNSGDITDSTSNGKHGTAETSMTFSDLVPGQISNGIDFDGDNDYLWMPDPLNANTMTISVWIKSADFTQSWHTIAQRSDTANNWYDWQLYARADDAPLQYASVFRIDFDNAGDADEEAWSDIVLSTGTWYYLVGTYNGSFLKFYRDGDYKNQYADTRDIPDTNEDMWIAMNSVWSEPFTGIIDEVRISTIARTDSWIETSYNNQFNPSAFYKSIGSQEDIPAVDIVVSVYDTNTNGGTTHEIKTSSTITIDPSTTNPYELSIGDGAEQTFTEADPRLLRLHVDVGAVRNSGSFTFAYDSAANPSSLDTPAMTVPEWDLAFFLLVPVIPAVISAFWRRKRLTMNVISILLAACIAIGMFATDVQEAAAAPTLDVDSSNTFWWYDDTTPLTYMMYQTQPSGSNTSASGSTVSFYSDTWPAGWQVSAGTSTVYFYVQTTGNKTVDFELFAGSTGSWTSLGTGSWSGKASTITLVNTSFSTNSFTFSTGERIRLDVDVAVGATAYWDGSYNNSRLVTPTIVVSEAAIGLVLAVAALPLMIRSIKKRKKQQGRAKRKRQRR